MNPCRIFPSSVQGWRPLLQQAVATCHGGATATNNNNNNNIVIQSPPHFQAYCINPETNTVREGFDYSSMLSANNMPSPKRKSGVLVLVEPVKYVSKNQNSTNNNKALPLLQNELRTFVTRRTSHLRTHKGEISYPGGKCDDGETVEQAAIREGMEEIGADPSKYEIIGQLSQVYSFPSRSMVTPTLAVSKDVSVVELDEAQEQMRYDRFVKKINDEEEKTRSWVGTPGQSSYSASFPSKQKEQKEEEKADDTHTTTHKSTNCVLTSPSSLDLKITSECEVESIQSINLLELLLSTEKHQFLERQWRAAGRDKEPPMRWMLPAFYTREEQDTLWGLTGFIFCELLSLIGGVLIQEHNNNNKNDDDDIDLTPFEREARKNLLTFFERSSKHYVERMDQVIGLPPQNHAVKFVNPYESIVERVIEK